MHSFGGLLEFVEISYTGPTPAKSRLEIPGCKRVGSLPQFLSDYIALNTWLAVPFSGIT